MDRLENPYRISWGLFSWPNSGSTASVLKLHPSPWPTAAPHVRRARSDLSGRPDQAAGSPHRSEKLQAFAPSAAAVSPAQPVPQPSSTTCNRSATQVQHTAAAGTALDPRRDGSSQSRLASKAAQSYMTCYTKLRDGMSRYSYTQQESSARDSGNAHGSILVQHLAFMFERARALFDKTSASRYLGCSDRP